MDALADHTTTTLAAGLDDLEVALLPTGAIAQHGPALPLGADLLVAEALATGLDRDDVLLLPPIPVGVSDRHRRFPGTLSTDPATFAAYVGDVVESLANHGLRKTVVVNGHGGNDDALGRVANDLRDARTAFAVPWNWWDEMHALVRELFDAEEIGHADAVETSMLYAVREDLVRTDALEEAEADAGEKRGPRHAGRDDFSDAADYSESDAADYSESGAVGEPTRASREAGERLFEQAVADLDALVGWLAERDFEDLLPPENR